MLLVIPPNFVSSLATPYLGIMYLAAVLKAEGEEVEIMDCQCDHHSVDHLMEAARRHDDIGFYMNFFATEWTKNVAPKIKSAFPRSRIIVGGPYPNAEPEKVLRQYADIVVIGEGEEPIKAIAAGRDLSTIPSLVYKTPEGEIARTERAPGWVDLDALPFPPWDMVDYRSYWAPNQRKKPMASLMTSRGCPNKCIYCSRIIHGRKLRMRSVESVVEELEYDSTRFGIREVHIYDDNLTVSVQRAKEICEGIIRRGLHKRMILALPGGIRPDRGDREMFQLLARAGVHFMGIAIEAANPEVSEKLGRGVNLARVPETMRMARDAGIIVTSHYILGSPFDTRATMQESIDFACRSDSNMISVFFMTPFPGTEIYNMLCDEGKIDPDTYETLFVRQYTTSNQPWFEANDWTKEDLLAIRKRFFRRFYLSPRRIFSSMFNFKLFITAIFSSLLKGRKKTESSEQSPY